MEQNTFTTLGTEKLQIPEVNFSSNPTNFNETKEEKLSTASEGVLKDNFTVHHYALAVFFVCVIILFIFFINGMSVYKGDTFIN